MLEQINLSKKMGKNVYQEKMEVLEQQLAKLQRECKSLGIPVIIAFEGLGASGKGLQISKLIYPLDPRGFQVFAIKKATEEEEMHPFLWRFWTKTPEKGRIAIFDTSWYRKVSVDRFEDKLSRDELTYAYQEINTFERTLTDDGTVLIKFFLYISQKEQKKRFDKLLDSKETAWRVSKEDMKRNKEYNRYKAMNEEMLEKTETEYAPWTIIEAEDRRFATAKIYTTVVEKLSEKVAERRAMLALEEEKKNAEQEKVQWKPKEEWHRAYREINDMEAHLAHSGAIVLKFWMQIDKDEQERRFKERMENPEKQWKITDEDWRNREKWDQYEEAVNEMIIKTSTSYAPWIIVEGNNKYYARIKVLESVVNAIEERLKK